LVPVALAFAKEPVAAGVVAQGVAGVDF